MIENILSVCTCWFTTKV